MSNDELPSEHRLKLENFEKLDRYLDFPREMNKKYGIYRCQVYASLLKQLERFQWMYQKVWMKPGNGGRIDVILRATLLNIE